jgi:hypothetical protein
MRHGRNERGLFSVPGNGQKLPLFPDALFVRSPQSWEIVFGHLQKPGRAVLAGSEEHQFSAVAI